MPSNYSTLKTTYKAYNDSQLGDTPAGWWGLIGSNKDQATIVNPGSAHSTAGTCWDFSTSWTADVNVKQPPIKYYYDKSGNLGTLTCKTTQSGPNRTATITCSGTKCCGGTGLNGLIPAEISFSGMVRPGDTSKPQCIENIQNLPECGYGKWVTNIDYATGTQNGFCMCDGGWTNNPSNSRSNPCTQKVMCPHPNNCGEGCNTGGNTDCGGWSNFCKDNKCKICCGSGNTGCGFMQQPKCKDENTNSYPCWCNNGPDKKGSQLMIQSGVPAGKSPIPAICDPKKGDQCCACDRDNKGKILPYKVGVSGCRDNGKSCVGGTCENPGNSTHNGIGCGWKIK